MACEGQEQVTDLARRRLDLDHTLDKVVTCMNLWKAELQEAKRANVAATLSLSLSPLSKFTKVAPTKLHVHRHGTTTKQTAHANISPVVDLSHVSNKKDHLSDNVSIAARSDGSTAVSHIDGSWTYINSPQSEHSSFVLLPSQPSSVAEERVSANDDFSPHLQPGAFPSAGVESSPLSNITGIGSWLNDVCAVDAQSLLLPQHASDEGELSIDRMGTDIESDLEMLLLHNSAMQSGGLMAGHDSGTMYPGSFGVKPTPTGTTEVTDLKLNAGAYWELPNSHRGEAPWTHLCVVGA